MNEPAPNPGFCRRQYDRLSRAFDRLMEGVERGALHDDSDFEADASWAISEQRVRGARLAVWLVLSCFFVLLLWAALARIDEVARGEGKVIPSRQVQILQSLDGGVVSEILVKEGQLVEVNQLLVKIDPTRFVSNLRENRAQYLALIAKAARLKALAEGVPFTLPPEAQKEVPQVVAEEMRLYESVEAETRAAIDIARQQLTQRNQELADMRVKRDQAARSYVLTNQELQVTRPLGKSGAVSEVELLRLERDVVRYRGERDSAAAQINRLQAAIEEAQHKIEEVELEKRNRAGSELGETNAKIAALSEGSVGLADRVKQSEIRSPVRGTVKQLMVATIGGVVQPGRDVVEVVPADDSLLIEAKVQPRDIAFLRPGQKARVKFTAYDFSVYGGLDGKLVHIGADSITDEKGNTYYEVRVRTDKSVIGDGKHPIIPGMVAEVDIQTGKKSVLSYLLKPVLRARESALTER